MPERFKIAIIGEAWGEEEAMFQRPFIGNAGKQLDSLLLDAGIDRNECFVTNVFNLHPERNDLATLCGEKRDPDCLGQWQPLVPGKYLRREYEAQVGRLLSELEEVRPNLAVLAGNTPCWALLERQAISKIRGTATYSSRLPWLKCLPIYHPAAVLRQYDLRHVTVLDLIKAKREGEFPELKRPERTLWLEPTLDDIRQFRDEYLARADRIAFDIETARGEITCISFAGSISTAIVIPFHDARSNTGSYWPSLAEELEAWRLVESILDLPAEKMGQNVLYDTQYLWQIYGIPVRNLAHDTMLLHHSLHPESDKGLGFLGSVYTNEPAWKTERPRGKHATLKRDDE